MYRKEQKIPLVTRRNRCTSTYLFWYMTTGSFSRSVRSRPLPLEMTSGCFLVNSQPIWAKKKPLLELWGSASVSEYL